MDNLREEEISKHLNERNHLLTCCSKVFLLWTTDGFQECSRCSFPSTESI